MIGALLSMKFVGKKSWKDSAIFWIVYIVVGAVIANILYTAIPQLATVSLAISAAIFIGLAHKWYHIDLWSSVKLFAVAFVIDIVIAFILIAILFATLQPIIESMMPGSQLFGYLG